LKRAIREPHPESSSTIVQSLNRYEDPGISMQPHPCTEADARGL
jgi:hypothetical protein